MSDMKVTFDDIILNKIIEDKIIKINNKEITVAQYLPVNNKTMLIGKILSAVVGDNQYNFVNPLHVTVYKTVEIIKAYTNIEFDEKMLIQDIYDILVREDLITEILEAIPEKEIIFISKNVDKTIEAYYNYKNSILGMLESVNQDYANLNLDTTEISQKMEEVGKSENLTLLKDVMNKLG